MSSSPNVTELKQCLQDAGIYEDNMNEDEMRGYYDAIKSSETTAKEEDEHRHCESGSSDTSQEQVGNEERKDDQNDTKKDDHQIGNDEILNAFDCKPSKSYKVNISSPSPRYKLPPYLDLKLRSLSVTERAKVISNFHRQQIHTFAEYHRKAKLFAPMGSPIVCGISIGQDDETNTDPYNDPTEATYVSRSGRHTKRIIYTEYNQRSPSSSSQKGPLNKRIKKDKNDNDYTPAHSSKKPHPEISNEEIMKRSRFFSDSPKSSASQLINKSNNEKVKLQDVEMTESPVKIQLGHKTSENKPKEDPVWLQSALSDNESDVEDVPSELEMIRRRIPPPLHGRKVIGSKKTCVASKNELDEHLSASSPQETWETSPLNSSISTSSNGTIKRKRTKSMTMCPICSECFTQDEIENHASNCGLGMTTPIVFEPASDRSSNTLHCAFCNKEMALSTEYEVHVQKCMRRESMK